MVAGITVPTFNSHRRNGDLPFVMSSGAAVDEGAKWASFSCHDAAAIVAAKDLAATQGVTWALAAAMIRERAIHVGDGHYSDTPGIHCVRVEFMADGGGEPELAGRSKVYRGNLSAVIGAACRHVEAVNARARVESDLIQIASVVSVNLSEAWKIAVARAVALGVAKPSGGMIGEDE